MAGEPIDDHNNENTDGESTDAESTDTESTNNGNVNTGNTNTGNINTGSNAGAPSARRAPFTRPKPPPRPGPVRYRLRTFYFVAIYIVILIVPWIITCVLDVKPVTTAGSSYVAVSGVYTPGELSAVGVWMRIISVLTAAAAVLTVPVISAALNHAVVVSIQRRRSAQPLSAWDMLSLVDAPWMRIEENAPWRRVKASRRTWLAGAGTCLMIVSILQFPLQYGLVTQQQLQVASCLDTPVPSNNAKVCHAFGSNAFTVGAYDPETGDLAAAPAGAIVPKVVSRLSTVYGQEPQPHLWPDVQGPIGTLINMQGTLWSSAFDPFSTDRIPTFVSALPTGFTTGVLREHALRFNSSVSCVSVPASAFPSVCPGARPFNGTYTGPTSRFRWCAPGAYDVYPWTNSRDRQDISEEVYFDGLMQGTSLLAKDEQQNFTVHCTVDSTRGYFELGNYYNNNTAGPLLETWPTKADLEANYNDARSQNFDYATPSVNDTTDGAGPPSWAPAANAYGDYSFPTPGPLMTSLLAMLGNESWFAPIANATTASAPNDTALITAALMQACALGPPLSSFASLDDEDNSFTFAGYTCDSLGITPLGPGLLQIGWGLPSGGYSIAQDLELVVGRWFQGFSEGTVGTASNLGSLGLGVGVFLAEEALLVAASIGGSSRPMFVAAGTTVVKPSVPLYAKIIVSTVVIFQVAALIALLVFIYRAPTFSSRVDAVTTAIIGGQLARATRLPAIQPVDAIDAAVVKRLGDVDGLIGAYGTKDPVEMRAYGTRARGGTVEGAGVDADDVSSRTVSVELQPQTVVAGAGWARVRPGRPGPVYGVRLGAPGLISRDIEKRYNDRETESLP